MEGTGMVIYDLLEVYRYMLIINQTESKEVRWWISSV